MSLIGDALRRARQDAADRETTSRGVVIRRVSVTPASSAGARRGLLVGVLIGVAVAAALVAVWLAIGRPASNASSTGLAPGDHPARPSATPAPAARETAGAASAHPGVPPAEAIGHAASDARQENAPSARPAATPATPRDATGNRITASAPGEAPAERPGPAAPGASRTEGRVYVLDADLGYAKLHLDFLVYKPSAPFGRINGQDVVPGSVVDGFRVEEIGPDFVRLADRHGPLTLRVR